MKAPRRAQVDPARPSASPTIREMQRQLNARGFNGGTPDGAKTQAALRDFQRSANLAITGEPNSRTLDALGIKQPLAARGSQV